MCTCMSSLYHNVDCGKYICVAPWWAAEQMQLHGSGMEEDNMQVHAVHVLFDSWMHARAYMKDHI